MRKKKRIQISEHKMDGNVKPRREGKMPKKATLVALTIGGGAEREGDVVEVQQASTGKAKVKCM